MARPAGVISTSVLRRSSGFGMRRTHPRRSSTSRVAVVLADATRTRSLICDGVSGSPAPSTTASMVAAGCGTSKVATMHRSSSAQSRRTCSNQGCECFGAAGIAAWVLGLVVGVDFDDAELGRGRADAPPRPPAIGLRQRRRSRSAAGRQLRRGPCQPSAAGHARSSPLARPTGSHA